MAKAKAKKATKSAAVWPPEPNVQRVLIALSVLFNIALLGLLIVIAVGVK